MYKFALATVLGLAVIGAAVPSAASDIGQSGAACQPQQSTTAVVYNQFGIANNSGAQNWVVCPVVTTAPTNNTAFVSRIFANVMDRSSSDDVFCTASTLNADGSVASTASFNTVGVNSPTSQARDVALGGQAARGVILECRLPAATASGHSHVNTFFIRTTH
jgi:hypothetical protein